MQRRRSSARRAFSTSSPQRLNCSRRSSFIPAGVPDNDLYALAGPLTLITDTILYPDLLFRDDYLILRTMANEDKKDFNAMLRDSKGLPKITEIKDEAGRMKWGGSSLVIAPPMDYDKYMRQVPQGKLITTRTLRKKVASDYGAEVCCPLTCGIFVNIAAWASHQRSEDITPYWRTLKSDGQLNPRYPEGCEGQKERLIAEGHTIIEKGKKNKKYFVADYEKDLIEL